MIVVDCSQLGWCMDGGDIVVQHRHGIMDEHRIVTSYILCIYGSYIDTSEMNLIK